MDVNNDESPIPGGCVLFFVYAVVALILSYMHRHGITLP
jgi:hypothetical protein